MSVISEPGVAGDFRKIRSSSEWPIKNRAYKVLRTSWEGRRKRYGATSDVRELRSSEINP